MTKLPLSLLFLFYALEKAQRELEAQNASMREELSRCRLASTRLENELKASVDEIEARASEIKLKTREIENSLSLVEEMRRLLASRDASRSETQCMVEKLLRDNEKLQAEVSRTEQRLTSMEETQNSCEEMKKTLEAEVGEQRHLLEVRNLELVHSISGLEGLQQRCDDLEARAKQSDSTCETLAQALAAGSDLNCEPHLEHTFSLC